MKIRKAVIPAAGLGTRFLPATKAQPKEMLPIVDKPTIQYIIEEAVQAGIEDILIITGRTKKAIEDHFDRSIELEIELERSGKEEMLEMIRGISSRANIHYIRQKVPLGLGHAIWCSKSFVGNEPFAVLLGDDIIDSPDNPAIGQLMNVYAKTKCSVIGVQEVPKDQVSKYGIIDPAQKLWGNVCQIRDLVEKPPLELAPSQMAIMGRYIIKPEIFDILKDTKPGRNGEIQLTDALSELLNFQPIHACLFSGQRYDVGDKLGFLAATIQFALQRDDIKEAFADYLTTVCLDRKLLSNNSFEEET